MLTNPLTMIYNITCARKIPRQLYFSTIYNWREVRCESMSNVIAKESITRNQAFVVKRNLKPQENVNIINCAQKSLAVLSGIFIIIKKNNRER